MSVVLKARIDFLILMLTTILLASTIGVLEAAFNDQCQSDSDCTGYLNYCCEKRYSYEQKVCASNCLFDSCGTDDDCAPSECCNSDNKCRSFCSETDISVALASWVIAVIVISVIVVVVIPVSIVVCCCCCGAAAASRRPAPGVVFAQPVAGTAVVVGQNFQTQQYPATNPQQGHNNFPDQQNKIPPPSY